MKVLEYCNFDFTGQENICLYYDCVQCTESHVLLVYKVFKYMFTVNWFCWSRIYLCIYFTLNWILQEDILVSLFDQTSTVSGS